MRARPSIALWLVGSALGLGLGCGLDRSGLLVEDAGGLDASDGSVRDVAVADADAASSEAGLDGGIESSCAQGTGGPTMVPAIGFCIDSTEVTKAQYAKFLAAIGDGGTDAGPSFAAECAGEKVSQLVPGTPWDPVANPNKPVTKVDWCAAFAFCRWAGKRLCGKRGGGPLEDAIAANDFARNQWYAACSQSGLRTYCYGANFDKNLCRSDDNGKKPIDVGTMPTCTGGYADLYDMTGNVAEWIDQCAGPQPNDDCVAQGGDYGANDNDSKCDGTVHHARDDRGQDGVGFRCCN